MAYADAANYNKVRSAKGLPIGAIIPWSGGPDTIPPGWIECNGAVIPYSRYPLLYDRIGNVYGGVVGSTFKVPALTAGNSAPMDIFKGHFDYLQNKGDAHKPEFTVLSSDPFWKEVGQSGNGDQSGNVSQNHTTTIDVFGEQTSKPDLTAKYGDFELSEGEVQLTLQATERKLSDRHLPQHNHNYNASGDVSYKRKSKLAAGNWQSKFQDYWPCYVTASKANVSRSTNDSDYPKTGQDMATVGASKNVSTGYRQGGGNIISDSPAGGGQYASTGFDNGDGVSGGQMYSHNGGTKYFFTSLSNDAKNFSELIGHAHTIKDYKFQSKIKLLNPGLVSDCKINTVVINNTTGQSFCTINMNSATPNLAMMFIIRAY